MAPVLSRSLTSASITSLPSFSNNSNNNKTGALKFRNSLLPQNVLSSRGLKWRFQKREHRLVVRCEAAVAEPQVSEEGSGEKYEYQAEISQISLEALDMRRRKRWKGSLLQLIHIGSVIYQVNEGRHTIEEVTEEVVTFLKKKRKDLENTCCLFLAGFSEEQQTYLVIQMGDGMETKYYSSTGCYASLGSGGFQAEYELGKLLPPQSVAGSGFIAVPSIDCGF